MNKCLTVLLNLIVWDRHAAPGGIASLVLCLIGGSLYRQAPLRKSKAGIGLAIAEQADDVWDTELSMDDRQALLDAEEENLSGSHKRRGKSPIATHKI